MARGVATAYRRVVRAFGGISPARLAHVEPKTSVVPATDTTTGFFTTGRPHFGLAHLTAGAPGRTASPACAGAHRARNTAARVLGSRTTGHP